MYDIWSIKHAFDQTIPDFNYTIMESQFMMFHKRMAHYQDILNSTLYVAESKNTIFNVTTRMTINKHCACDNNYYNYL